MQAVISQRPRAQGKLLEENGRVIVTEWRLAPGAETVEHNFVNPNSGEFAFVEIELK